MKGEGTVRSLRFAAILATVCALVLTGVGRWTAPHREAHRRAAELRSLLLALELPVSSDAGSAELLQHFEAAVETLQGKGMNGYGRRGSSLIALRFEGPGLWGPIRGYVSVDCGTARLRQFVIQHHEETPGIGGKIAEAAFSDRISGTRLGPVGRVFVLTKPGTTRGPGEIDGIAGATMTCRKVEGMVAPVLEATRSFWEMAAEPAQEPTTAPGKGVEP